LQSVAGHVCEFDARITEVHVGESIEVVTGAQFEAGPTQVAIVKIELKLVASAKRVRDAVSVEIRKPQLRVIECVGGGAAL
jgi:hypothetical protein